MKKVELLVFIILLVGYVSGQCNIKYNISNKEYYAINEAVHFSAFNHCKKSKFVLYSLEYKDSLRNWQEIDNDIYTIADKGMKILKLLPEKKQKFSFRIDGIDTIFFRGSVKNKFRIIENLYSDNKIEIVRTKEVKHFAISSKSKASIRVVKDELNFAP